MQNFLESENLSRLAVLLPYTICTGSLRGEGKEVQNTQARALLEGPRCCQTQRELVLVFRPAQEISHPYGDRNQQVLEVDLKKKTTSS